MLRNITPVVKTLLLINLSVFLLGLLLQFIGVSVIGMFALYPLDGFMPYQLITHQFLHAGLFHIAFNMLALISIGPAVENYIGSRKFLIYYLLCGLGSALLHMFMIHSSTPLVGASGAIYGILLMFTILNPDEKLYFFGIIGMKAKYLVSILFAIEIYLGFLSQGDGIGHFAHVGGGLTGIALLMVDKYVLKPNV